MKNNVKAILVQLEVDGKNALFIMLAKDGLINRRGTGTIDNTDRARFDFMGSDTLRAFLRRHYVTHIDKHDKKCINCANWDGSRTPKDERYDSMCKADKLYHKGSFACAGYFLRLT